MSPHPMNQAVISQALHDLRNGQLRHCLEMGFGERELEILKQPALLALLSTAQVPWCQVTVDRDLLWRLVSQLRQLEHEIDFIDRLLRLGAGAEMICKRFGLSHQELALRREILGLPQRRGRHPTLDEAEETELWRRWKDAVAGRGIALDDETAQLELAMRLAEGATATLSVIWHAMQGWIQRELA
jgi:hypothetical protein